MAANDSKQNGQSGEKKSNKARSSNDLEVLKLILDSDPALKKKVMRFMQKNYSKVLAQSTK
jgi:hypothetical protein